jgi:hypothetical protein
MRIYAALAGIAGTGLLLIVAGIFSLSSSAASKAPSVYQPAHTPGSYGNGLGVLTP